MEKFNVLNEWVSLLEKLLVEKNAIKNERRNSYKRRYYKYDKYKK